MKKLLILIAALLLSPQIGWAIDAQSNDDAEVLKTKDGANEFITRFLADLDPTETLAANGIFAEKTNQNGDVFFVAKALVTYHTSNGFHQEVRVIVLDVAKNWTATLNEDHYAAFLRTGNRALLSEHNLDPDPVTPHNPRLSGEGHEDSSPQSAQIVNIRDSGVVVTTTRASMKELIRLTGFHNKPAIRQLFGALTANKMAFILDPGTVIYVQETGKDGVDSILIRGQDREYFINHTDGTGARQLDALQ